jgi:hypothetical protein
MLKIFGLCLWGLQFNLYPIIRISITYNIGLKITY